MLYNVGDAVFHFTFSSHLFAFSFSLPASIFLAIYSNCLKELWKIISDVVQAHRLLVYYIMELR